MNLNEILTVLHTKMQDPTNWPVCGLCTALLNLDPPEGVSYDFQVLTRTWPKHSGDNVFPVPCPEGGKPGPAYYHAENEPYEVEARYMWDRETSPYAALRWELLEWAITQTKPED